MASPNRNSMAIPPPPSNLFPHEASEIMLEDFVLKMKSIQSFLDMRNQCDWHRWFTRRPSVLRLIPWLKFAKNDAIGFHDWHVGLLEESAQAGNLEARCLVGIQRAFNNSVRTSEHVQYLEEARDSGLLLGQYAYGMYVVYRTMMDGVQDFNKYLPGLRIMMGSLRVESREIWAPERKIFVAALHDMMKLRLAFQVVLPNLCSWSYCLKKGQYHARIRSPLIVDEDGIVVCSALCLALKEFQFTMKHAWDFGSRDSLHRPPSSDEE